MSIVFRIVGHLSPVATSATDGGGTTEQPAEGDDMHFHLSILD